MGEIENDLGDLARVQDKRGLHHRGRAGNKGTLKNEGKVVIPTFTWKVAVIMPRDQGLANIRDYRDLEVIAVNMPNEPGIRNVPWQTYATTVDAIEALSGYDLLALLPDKVEAAVESDTQPPLAAVTGPAARHRRRRRGVVQRRGLARSRTAPSRATPGTSATARQARGATATHVYAQDGTYTVRADDHRQRRPDRHASCSP